MSISILERHGRFWRGMGGGAGLLQGFAGVQAGSLVLAWGFRLGFRRCGKNPKTNTYIINSTLL